MGRATDTERAPRDASATPTQRAERLRPRRLEPDTLSYLKEVAETLVQSKDELAEEDMELLLWNVLEELAPRAASASSDRHAGELIEVFLPRMSDGQLRYFLHKMEGYFSHLWTNRYSSHVLQQILSRASRIVEKEVQNDGQGDEDNDDGDDERLQGTPLMSEIVINMVTEVESEWLNLMNDVSASHVLRSVLAVLAGRPLVADKRGKKAKHRMITFAEAPVAKDGTVTVYQVPATFEALYQQILRKFRSTHTQEMLNLMYDTNSGPLLAAALKLAPPKAQSKLAQHVLQWSDEAASARMFYDFAGDAVTSHFLEALFGSVSDEFFAAIFHRCLTGKLLEFAEHPIANYVVQNAIQRVNTHELAKEVLSELDGAMWKLLSVARSGVVWRLVEMCRRLGVHTREIFTAVSDAVAKQESKKPEAARRELVPALLSLQLATAGTNKVHLNVMGAKILSEFIALEYASWLEPLYNGVVSLNVAQLKALAMDSTGSRCIVEPIWESEDAARAWVRQRMFALFQGHFGELALDRLGAFSVIKCYERLPLADKASVATELLAVEGKLSGSHFAQLVMNTVHLHEFRNNREKWEALYEKKDKIADLFKDFEDDDDTNAVDSKKNEKKKKHKIKEENKTDKKRKAAEDVSTNEDVAAIMGALRGTVDAKKPKKKSKTKKRDD